MSRASAQLDADLLANDSPVVWFFRLEASVRREEYELAAIAHRHLTRLGVDVFFSGARWKKFSDKGPDQSPPPAGALAGSGPVSSH